MKFGNLIMTATAVAVASPALAAPTIFFGEDQVPLNSVSGAPLTARNNFFAQLTGNSIEDFEGLTAGAAPSSLTFTGSAGNIVASLSGGGTIIDVLSSAGRFPTSGTNSFETRSDFGATFSTAIAAFGFYGTDIGDFSGQLKITLVRAGGNETVLVPHTVAGTNGSLLFYGVIDTVNPFTGVQFSTTSGVDFFGFDDITVGDVAQVTGAVPEPATWAMMLGGVGLVGGALRTRRRKTTVSFA